MIESIFSSCTSLSTVFSTVEISCCFLASSDLRDYELLTSDSMDPLEDSFDFTDLTTSFSLM